MHNKRWTSKESPIAQELLPTYPFNLQCWFRIASTLRQRISIDLSQRDANRWWSVMVTENDRWSRVAGRNYLSWPDFLALTLTDSTSSRLSAVCASCDRSFTKVWRKFRVRQKSSRQTTEFFHSVVNNCQGRWSMLKFYFVEYYEY